MSRHLRPARSAWLLWTLLSVTWSGIGRASPPLLGILEADSAGSCVLLHERLSEARYLVSDPGSFSVGDTVVAWYGRIDTVSCGSSGTYPHFRWVTLSSRSNFSACCGWIEIQGECLIFRNSDLDLRTVLLVACTPEGATCYNLTGELLWECDPSSPCQADFCLTGCQLEVCPDPAVEETTWGRIKHQYGPELPGR